ncbi:MAG TPA: bifunctional phosphopantothenoylcysteine decarboxylase/phosphopantothenate--cysteine ligase CoaBC [Candidatus Dormibacteraeota bacterium]|nr:bifunctional phosphopantothenoylcysteine decarboxylase/phosphopantothenate--cysteine ligase CoaBC [Candidatus Dormibacteraeota bacterium]
MNAHLARRAFSGRRLLVGVCGGIAAYKAAETVSMLVQAGAQVRVVMTPEAVRFITPLTFEALSGQPVASDLYGPQTAAAREGGEAHIALSDWPEAILVVPATANFIAKLAHGLADEALSTTVLASNVPLVLAPAMHSRMWENEATNANIASLLARGVTLAGPVEGHLASGDVGYGRLADQEAILRTLRAVLPGTRDMEGLSVLVSAGGTRESLDPVRYIGNRSSGLMGHAVAAVAEGRGARVTLVTTSKLSEPRGVEVVHVDSAAQMGEALRARAESSDILVMAAAVADFRPRDVAVQKIRKADVPEVLELERNEDIVASIDPGAGGRLVKVGFAAETHELLARAQEKLMAKRLDLVVANDISDPTIGMGSPDNAVTIISRDGAHHKVERAPKEDVAHEILSAAMAVLKTAGEGQKAS